MMFSKISPGRTLVMLLVVCGFVPSASALTNGLALTPPMGWNSWYKFQGNIDENLIREMADAMATNGMKELGYQYINLDDCWQMGRDTTGFPLADPAKFPGGMKALADYIHSKGLKFGLYSSRATNAGFCGGNKGSYGYEVIDANAYACWGVDFLKYDNFPSPGTVQSDFTKMRDAVLACGRPMVYSFCSSWFETWMPECGNMWRTAMDRVDTFENMCYTLDRNNGAAAFAGPGRWNDPDMLLPGVFDRMKDVEYRSQFGIWCMMAAPLLAANDLRFMTPATREILMADEVIAVDQDPAGIQGIRLSSVPAGGGPLEVWSKPVENTSTTRAVALFNRSTNAAEITIYWTNLNLRVGIAQVRDLWAKVNLGPFTNSFTATVQPHEARLVKVTGEPGLRTVYLSDLPWVSAISGWGPVVRDYTLVGEPLASGGVTYAKGLSGCANSQIRYNLGGLASMLFSEIGVHSSSGTNGTVVFQVWGDGAKLYDSGMMTGGSPPKAISVDIRSRRYVELVVNDSGSSSTSDLSVWGLARVITLPGPSFRALASSPGQVVLRAFGAPPGSACYLVSSADCGLPVSHWTREETNSFSSTGTATFTNRLEKGLRQKFYALELPLSQE